MEDRTQARVTGYISDIFTTEEHLEISVGLIGPTATNIAVTPMMQFYGGGLYFQPEECVVSESETVPPECREEREGILSYTCLNKVTPPPPPRYLHSSIYCSERSQLRRADAGPL